MPRRLHRHCLTLWIALAAVLLGALMPARAMPVEEAYALLGLDICAARYAGQDDGVQPANKAHHTHCDHCPGGSMVHAPALPGLVWTSRLPSALAHEAPPLFFTAPRPLQAWVRARSRAPPALA